MFERLPSSHCSVLALMPSPHTTAMQLPSTQFFVDSQVVPGVFVRRGEQIWVFASQVPEVMQTLFDWQSRPATDGTQENVQSGSHPSPFARLPSSHSSVPSILPFPQYLSVQTLFTQIFPVPQSARSVSGVPGMQVCVASWHVAMPGQGSVVRQLRVGSVETQVKRQLSQPSPLTVLPSSHSSAGAPVRVTRSMRPSPHTGAAGTQTPAMQRFASPHLAPSGKGPFEGRH